MPAPEMQRPGVAAAATAGSAFGGAAAGALLGSLACGEAGAVIGAVALVITFAAGYGMWSAYVLAQAHGSLLRLLWSAFRRRHERKALDREEWRAEFEAMWARALRWTFLFWLNALWTAPIAAIAMAICAPQGRALLAAATFAAVLGYGLLLARLARRGYLIPPEE
ncbi:MAG TPA: hypothetical protein VLF42_06570 [Burkholderiales bacterium]|nr:hypothetical protein [Burkholderiales bacterium]